MLFLLKHHAAGESQQEKGLEGPGEGMARGIKHRWGAGWQVVVHRVGGLLGADMGRLWHRVRGRVGGNLGRLWHRVGGLVGENGLGKESSVKGFSSALVCLWSLLGLCCISLLRHFLTETCSLTAAVCAVQAWCAI